MTQHDPLDDLLYQAFAADAARTPTVRVTDRVMARIRRRQRIRRLTLVATVLVSLPVSLVSLAAFVEPALAGLLDLVSRNVAGDGSADALIYGALAVAAAGGLMLMDWESA